MDFNKNKINKNKIVRRISHDNDRFLQIWAGGREIICTPRHTIFTTTSNGLSAVEASSLKSGMYVAGIKEIRYEGYLQHNPQFWRLVGYILGDGLLSEARRGIILTDKNKENIDFYSSIASSVIRRRPTITRGVNYNSWLLNIYDVRFLQKLRLLGITQKGNQRRGARACVRRPGA